MLNFDAYFLGNPFDASEVTPGRLSRYSSEHASRLAANPRFAHLAEPTWAMHKSCFGLLAEEGIHTTISESATQMMRESRVAFLDMVSQYEGGVRMIWGKGSPEYQRFYPEGVSEYRRANLQNIDDLLIRYERAVLEFERELPADFVDAFLAPTTDEHPGGVIHRFRAARAAQLGAKGTKVQSGELFDQNRAKLEAHLMKNLHLVAAEVTAGTDLEKREARRLFPQHILKKVSRKKGQLPEDQKDGTDSETPTDAAMPSVTRAATEAEVKPATPTATAPETPATGATMQLSN